MFRRSLSSLVRDQSGAVSIIAAISIVLLLGVAAIVIDIGSLYFTRRNLQATDDAAALAAVQNPSNAAAVAAAVFEQNGYSGETLTVATGVYTPDESIGANSRFTASGTGVNAVQVSASMQGTGYFASLFGLSSTVALATQSTATRIPTASFGAGTRLAELNAGLINAVLGQLWGSSLSLSLVDYQALVTTNVDALTFLNQLAADINVTGDYSNLAGASVTVGQIINALVETTSAGAVTGDESDALIGLQTLQSQVNNNTPMALSNVIDLTPLKGRTIGGIQSNGQGLQLNMMSLLSASARDTASATTTNLGTAITIPVTNSTVSTRIAAGNQMAQVADAQVGTTINTGQIRMALTVVVTNVNLGITTADVQIPIYLEVAPGQAQLIAMPCLVGSTLAQIDATSGTTTLGFGTVSDSALSDFSTPVAPVVAPIVSLSIPIPLLPSIPIQVNILGSVGINGAGPETLSFTQADIDDDDIQSPSTDNTPFNDLSSNTTLTTTVLSSIPSGQSGLISSTLSSLTSTLNPVVTNLISQLNTPVNSVLTALGVQLGTIDVRVFNTNCSTPTLVE